MENKILLFNRNFSFIKIMAFFLFLKSKINKKIDIKIDDKEKDSGNDDEKKWLLCHVCQNRIAKKKIK